MERNELIKYIEEKYKFALADDFFGLLDITLESSNDEIKSAFFKLARVFHPDVLKKYDLSEREIEKGRFIFKKLSEAYNTLTNKSRRDSYIIKMKTQTPPEGEKLSRSPDEEAEIYYHKAQILMRRKSYKEAEFFLKKALAIRPNETRYLLDLGWIIFQDAEKPLKKRIEEARKYFEKAMNMGQNDPRAYYYMALYYKAKEDYENMYDALKDALTINPKYVDARRELRLLKIRMKKIKARERNPFYKLLKLFKKK